MIVSHVFAEKPDTDSSLTQLTRPWSPCHAFTALEPSPGRRVSTGQQAGLLCKFGLETLHVDGRLRVRDQQHHLSSILLCRRPHLRMPVASTQSLDAPTQLSHSASMLSLGRNHEAPSVNQPAPCMASTFAFYFFFADRLMLLCVPCMAVSKCCCCHFGSQDALINSHASWWLLSMSGCILRAHMYIHRLIQRPQCLVVALLAFRTQYISPCSKFRMWPQTDADTMTVCVVFAHHASWRVLPVLL